MTLLRKTKTLLSTLCRDISGLAVIEFAYVMPIFTAVGIGGIEMTNYANTNMKISQAAMALADNMSRVGLESSLSSVQIREADVNDGLIGFQRQTGNLNFGLNGRVILSSLERNAEGGQWIHWQRCFGSMAVAPRYGTQDTGITGTAFLGMGPSTGRVTAPIDTAVMFVEVTYTYQPLFTGFFLRDRTIRHEASFINRDPRDLAQIYNPNPAATVATCT
ncbi:MAG: TadE family protein [Pseudomonadota bacterium]|mgnify:CR=1 FL=1